MSQDYGKLGVALNGNVLRQLSSIGIEWNSGQNRVDLLNEGLSGFTPGSGDVSINLGFHLPLSGLEEDFIGKLVDGEFVTMQVFGGPKSYVGKGKIMTAGLDQSVNGAVEGKLSWTGELRKLQ